MLKYLLITLMAFVLSNPASAAFSSSLSKSGQIAGMRMEIYEVSFASVTAGTVVTGMNHVLHAHFTNETTDDHGVTNKNSASASATEDDPGQVHVSGVTSSDTGTLIVYGN